MLLLLHRCRLFLHLTRRRYRQFATSPCGAPVPRRHRSPFTSAGRGRMEWSDRGVSLHGGQVVSWRNDNGEEFFTRSKMTLFHLSFPSSYCPLHVM
uniref:Uncharacterized protein n=1 Tax=Setaria viridis TaxID=4556 RepID=A0A4U6V0M4_SETVI|nr:hypothetical protein SEVIR_4G231304v2 [Setaria viridis]